MARKTKEEVLENKEIKKTNTKSAENKKSAVKSVAKKTSTKKDVKTSSTKKTPSKKEPLKELDIKNIETPNKSKTTSKAKTAKSSVSSKEKKTTTKAKAAKATSTSSKEKKSTTKVKAAKATSTSSKEKKTTTKAKATKSTTNTKSKKTTKKSTSSKTTKRVVSKKASTKTNLDLPEYYDLPYRYNKTIVKVLAQNPNTLFVYWDVSDEDRLNFEKNYGNDFFSTTKPVLVIHNLTDNYTFEIDINDFANNWYVNVNDTKCKYFVELGRRPYHNSDVINKTINYLNIAFSNTIEIPNDHILFFKENDRIYFKNIKTNKITEKVIKTYKNNLHGIYNTYDFIEDNDRFDFNNPSSQNPSSSSSFSLL